MSAARDVRLPPYLVRVKMGCADALARVDNQKRVAEIANRSQGRISDFCNPMVPDFMPLDVALRIDAESLALTGVAPIADAMAEAREVLANGGMVDAVEPISVHLARFAEKSAELTARPALFISIWMRIGSQSVVRPQPLAQAMKSARLSMPGGLRALPSMPNFCVGCWRRLGCRIPSILRSMRKRRGAL